MIYLITFKKNCICNFMSKSYWYDFIWKLLKTVLMLLGARSFSRVFLSCCHCFFLNFIPRLNSTCNYWILPIPICPIEGFYKVTFSRTRGFIVMLIWGKINHVLKTDGVELFTDLLINKIFSKDILSWNVKIELSLNRGLVWKFLGWKIMILAGFFL